MITFQEMPDEILAGIVNHLDIHSTARFFKTSKALHNNSDIKQDAESKRLIDRVICGYSHTMLLGTAGSVYACGYNESGHLGLGDDKDEYTFKRVKSLDDIEIEQVVCNDDDTMLLGKNGDVYVCGDNEWGKLGLGNNEDRNTFKRVELPAGVAIQHVDSGVEHTILLDKNGGVYACGANRLGQLGLGNNEDRNTFKRVELPAGVAIQHVDSGVEHTILLDKNGGVYACGANRLGQLGLGNNEDRNTFERVELPAGVEIQHVVCGSFHTILLDKNGEVYICGPNECGQLGLGNNENRNTFTRVESLAGIAIQCVVCSVNSTMLLDNAGSVYACGANWSGQLGLGNDEDRNTFERVELPAGVEIQHVVCSARHTILLDKNGGVYACGANENGQLGLGNTVNQNTFKRVESLAGIEIQHVASGAEHTILLDNAGSVYACGANENGQLGLGNTKTIQHTFECVQEGLPRWEWASFTQHNTASRKRRLENDRPLEEASSGLGL